MPSVLFLLINTDSSRLHGSYSSLGRDFKTLFEDLVKHINTQKAEAYELRQQLNAASDLAMQSNLAATTKLDEVLEEERKQAAADRQNLLSQIASLVTAQGDAQDQRLGAQISEVQKSVLSSNEAFEASRSRYSQGMESWNEKEVKLVEEVLRSRETLKSKLKEDWVVSTYCQRKPLLLTTSQAANKHNSSLQAATRSVHDETVRIVDEQMKDIATQMQALDDFVTRARSQNAQHHDSHTKSLDGLSSTVKSSYSNIGLHFTSTYERVRDLGNEMSTKTTVLQESLTPLDSVLRQPLAELRSNISNTVLQEYQPTGETPQKTQYQYPTELPRTEAHETLLAALRRPAFFTSPTKTMIPVIFNDAPSGSDEVTTPSEEGDRRPTGGLREIDANISAGSLSSEALHQNVSGGALGTVKHSNGDGPLPQIPSFKRSTSGKLPLPKSAKKPVVALEGRENNTQLFSQSTGRRRSPRTG
jgi:kinesin family protein 11